MSRKTSYINYSIRIHKPGMVAHTSNPSTQEVEASSGCPGLWRLYTTWPQIYDVLEKAQLGRGKVQWLWGLVEREGWVSKGRREFSQEWPNIRITLQWCAPLWIRPNQLCSYKRDPSVDSGLWSIRMCHCIHHCIECIPLVKDRGSGKAVHLWECICTRMCGTSLFRWE